MNKIKIFENFLELDFIKNLKFILHNEVPNFIWKSSLSWPDNIRKSSSLILICNLNNEKYIYNYFREKYNNLFSELKDKKIIINYYIHSKLSYIPFHGDEDHVFASTIYLNEHWNVDYGGLFLYQEDNEIKAIVPKFNLAVTNSNNIKHGTSLTTMDAPYRETIQIFFNQVK